MSKQSPDCPLCPAPPRPAPPTTQQHAYQWTYTVNGDPPAHPTRCAFTAAGRYACQSGVDGNATIPRHALPARVVPNPGDMASIAATNVSTVAALSVPKAGCLY